MSVSHMLVATLLLACSSAALAAFPARYSPMVVQPTGAPQRYEFDLSAALARAQRENKRLYVYLGASDCPFCRKYEAFLEKNADALVSPFGKNYIVVDLRSALAAQADKLYFRIGNTSLPYAEFLRSFNDERERKLVYPSVWLFNGQAKTLMQMPAGTGTFETVPEQIEILNLVQ